MDFHEDVMRIMEQHGCLPVSTPEKMLKINDELKLIRSELTSAEAKLLAENKALKAYIHKLEVYSS